MSTRSTERYHEGLLGAGELVFAGVVSLLSMLVLALVLCMGCSAEVDVQGAACDGQDHPCPDGYDCIKGTCFEVEPFGVTCRADGDCPAGVCLTQANVCVGCLAHGDCISGLCEIHSHICIGCKGDYQCPSGECDKDSGICAESSTKALPDSNL